MDIQVDDIIDRVSIAQTEWLIRPHIRRPPVIEVDAADFGLGAARFSFKLELLQHAGSFKKRGAFTNLLTREFPRGFLIEQPKDWHSSTPGCTPIASTIPLHGSVSGSPAFSVSAFGPAKKSARGSKRSTAIPARSTSSSTRIFISIMSAATG